MNLELGDIQAAALRPDPLPVGTYLFLRFGDAAQERGWLQAIAGRVTSVAAWDATGGTIWNVALTAAGLRTLGLPEDTVQTFAPEFVEGMAAPARSALLGDTGTSGPEHWEPGLRDPTTHALLLLNAATDEALVAARADHAAILAALPGVTVLYEQAVALLPGLREHFGYRDGISQPAIAGSGLPVRPGQEPVLRAGEFILGTLDQNNEYPAAPQPAVLGRNGTYLVWRKLHEDVAGFRAFLQQNAATPNAEERLAAKLMGRWRSGAPLSLSPDHDDPALGADAARNNHFRYLADDPKGLTCPLGSHVRRAYARDALNGPLTDVQRHRVLRRGMPYGPPLPPGAPDDGADRGLIFVALGASIARQFEFVQSVWLNNSDFIGQSGDRDPIVGANDGTTHTVIPQKPLRRRILNLPRFVTVRGGGYFFLPGVQALNILAAGG